jgi:hypothetical protein
MTDTGNLGQYPAVPESFSLLSAPMPAMLPSLVGHNGISRFFSLYYYGSKAVWDTGWESRTFPYYAGYAPLINHPVVGIDLLDKDLGSDDGPPVHALLCDRKTARMYVGRWQDVFTFLQRRNPQPLAPTPEESERLIPDSLEELRDLGLFEVMLGATDGKKQLCAEMVSWLDGHITADLIERYKTAAARGDLNALWILISFKQRASGGDPGRESNT